MTDEEIDAMPTGYKLDGLVAEKVMGWTIDKYYPDYGFPPEEVLKVAWGAKKIPEYSTDLSVAWKLIERLGANYSISMGSHDGGKTWQCILEAHDNKMRFPVEVVHPGDVYASAETLPLAICHVALRACR